MCLLCTRSGTEWHITLDKACRNTLWYHSSICLKPKSSYLITFTGLLNFSHSVVNPIYETFNSLLTFNFIFSFYLKEKRNSVRLLKVCWWSPGPYSPFKAGFWGLSLYNVNRRSKQDPMDWSLTSETYVHTNAADFPRCAAERKKKLEGVKLPP